MSFNASLLVMMAIFWVTYLILRVFFFKPIMALLDERKSRIETAQAAFDGATRETDETVEQERARLSEARSQAMASRDKERREAQARRHEQLNQVKAEVQETLARAAADLEATVARERENLDQRATEIADRMAEKLLGRPA